MKPSRWRLELEELSQARRIHGGTVGLCIAALGVQLSKMHIPTRRLRRMLYGSVFGGKYPPGLDESEAEKRLDDYPSLNAVFTRALKPQARPIDQRPGHLVSPCDGTVQEIGRVDAGKILTLKGIEYSLSSLLPRVDVTPYENGHFAIVFLSPIDCHRVFSPSEGRLEEVIHVPGSRLLVHPPFQRPEFPTYTLNERVLIRLSTPLGPCLLVMVAGWGVGNITLPSLPIFRPRRGISQHTFARPQELKRGDWLATFELGSTVALFTPSASASPLVASTTKVKYGQSVFHISS